MAGFLPPYDRFLNDVTHVHREDSFAQQPYEYRRRQCPLLGSVIRIDCIDFPFALVRLATMSNDGTGDLVLMDLRVVELRKIKNRRFRNILMTQHVNIMNTDLHGQ